MFTLLKNIPKIFYYTTALTKCETNSAEMKEKNFNFLREDRGLDVKNLYNSPKCNA